MAWDPTPWLVGGGAEHSPEVARLLSYATTSGAEGIVEPSDLRVRALNVPGAGFRVGLGAALIRNRYAGGQQQTYAARNTSEHNFTDVTPTGSGGGRTDLVIARVIDPQYEGDVPADPTDHQYVFTDVIQGVPSSTRTARELNLGYPAIELAKITWPSSTATITDAMITDLRQVALPRKDRNLRAYQLYIADSQSLHTGSVVWPDIATTTMFIPEWARIVQVVGTWATVKGTGLAEGICFVRFTAGGQTFETQHSRWRIPDQADSRNTFVLADDLNIPSWARGQDVTVQMMATKNSGPNVYADGASSIALDVEFSERAL